MAAYSLDLRQRIVDALERGDQTRREVAEMFNVHESFVYKLLRQQRERGDLSPLPHGGGAVAKLDSGHLALLSEMVAESPDATLDELREQLKKKARVEASITTIWRALDDLGLSRKKSPSGRRKPIRSNALNLKKSRKGSP